MATKKPRIAPRLINAYMKLSTPKKFAFGV